MTRKYVYKKRTFLNKNPTMSAFIIAAVEKFSYGRKNDELVSGYPTFDIADCREKISIDFSFYGEKEVEEAHQKIKLLKSVVDGFHDAFEKEVTEHKNRNPLPKTKTKTKNKI